MILEVLEVDILWPRWVARIGVTRSTQACFLAADRQCTELPLLRLPRLVHEFRGSDPMRQTRDLARVGWRGLAPLLPIGPRERPRLADSFFAPGSGARGIPRVARPAIRRVAAMRAATGRQIQRSGHPPAIHWKGTKAPLSAIHRRSFPSLKLATPSMDEGDVASSFVPGTVRAGRHRTLRSTLAFISPTAGRECSRHQ